METLSSELKTEILTYLPPRDLKATRLTSRALLLPATDLLFAHITLSPSSLFKIATIFSPQSTSNIPSHVRSIRITDFYRLEGGGYMTDEEQDLRDAVRDVIRFENALSLEFVFSQRCEMSHVLKRVSEALELDNGMTSRLSRVSIGYLAGI
jgi:hypothetical protein